MPLAELVDLARYPIHNSDGSEFANLVAQVRIALAADGACVLAGFVPSQAIEQIVAAVDERGPRAFHQAKQHNVYLAADDPAFDPTHPRNAKQTTTSATLGYDYLRDVEHLEDLYRSPEQMQFLAACLGYTELHPYEDALSPVNVLFYPPGSSLGWHFDNAAFTVTVMLREAASGAAFEYAPFLRSESDPAYDAVGRVVAGDRRPVKTMSQSAGTMVLFRGHMTMHRVTQVVGATTRLLATFVYSPQPGARMLAVNQQTFYGRIVDGAP